MKNLCGKLNNNEGKTILMALFLLLVAVVVSVVIITAASTAAHQLNDNKEAQQAYLTASSAAQFFRDEIENQKYVYTERVYTPQGNAGNKASEYNESTLPKGEFADILSDIARKIKNNELNSSISVYKEGTVSINENGADSSFDNVDVKIYIQQLSGDNNVSNMDITFEVAGKSKDEYGYKMNLSADIEKHVTKSTTTYSEGYWNNRKTWYVNETTTTITFGSGIISKGAGQ